MIVEYPCRIESVANLREHWSERAKRAKAQRWNAYIECRAEMWGERKSIHPPCTIKLTRIAPRQITDGDNLQSGFKSVRDGVADFLDHDDGDPLIKWEYHQEKGRPKQYAVRIEISET